MTGGAIAARRGARRGECARALAGLLLSLCVNIAALLAVSRAGAPGAPALRSSRVVLSPLSPSRWAVNRSVASAVAAEAEPAPAPPAAAARRSVPERREAEATGPTIRVAPSPDGRPPERARFRSDRDNTVARDVQSRDAGRRTWDTALAAPIEGPRGAQGIPLPGDGGQGDASAPGRAGPPPPERAEEAVARARQALAPPAADPSERSAPGASRDPAGQAAAPRALGTDGEGGQRRSGRYDPRLLPTASTFARLSGGPGPRVPGVDEGDQTALSTRRFKYADFHLRVKESVVREWDPNRAFDARDPDARRYGRQKRGATVDIVLDPSGALREVRVVRTSGLDFYDRELVRAIRAAAPFPNPPRGLVGADGLIVLRSWRFDLEFDDSVLPALGNLTGGAKLPR